MISDATATNNGLGQPPHKSTVMLPFIRRPCNVFNIFEFKPVTELFCPFVAINGNPVIFGPATDAFDHDTITATKRDWWRDNSVSYPVDVHFLKQFNERNTPVSIGNSMAFKTASLTTSAQVEHAHLTRLMLGINTSFEAIKLPANHLRSIIDFFTIKAVN